MVGAVIRLVVRDSEEATSGKLKLFFLPGYAPELKPDELAWSCVKRASSAKRPRGSNQSLQDRIEAGLVNLQSNPGLIRSFCNGDMQAQRQANNLNRNDFGGCLRQST